jgi:hypothetical protein
MRRRSYLRVLPVTVGSAVLAGCRSMGGTPDTGNDRTLPPVLADRPTAVYRPTHRSSVRVVGTADAGDFRFALLYSYPDRFWELVGRQTYRRSVEPDDSIHLMTLVWDPETGVVLPEVGLTAEIRDGDELVAREAVYAMLSQRLGFHYGDNFALPGDGDYTVHVSVGGLQIRRTGAFADRFADPATVTIPFPYRRTDRDALPFSRPANPGTRGALSPLDVEAVPAVRAPARDAIPGRHLGQRTTGDAVLDAVHLTGAEASGRSAADDEEYFAVLSRTPHSGLLLPAMGLEVRIERDGESRFEGTLSRTIDPELGYHYGAPVPPLSASDSITVRVLTPPQVARHEGYETAFVDMPPVSWSG